MKLKKVEFLTSVADFSSIPRKQLPTIAFAGRSNVGKSSLINTILNRKNLAKTSSTPGKTRFINYFIINDKLYLADLPGYGFARAPKHLKDHWQKLIEPFLKKNDMLKRVFILIDIRHGIKETDLQLIEYMTHVDRDFRIVLTKYDKVSKNQAAKLREEIFRDLNLENRPIFFSALNKTGASDIWSAILQNGEIRI